MRIHGTQREEMHFFILSAMDPHITLFWVKIPFTLAPTVIQLSAEHSLPHLLQNNFFISS